MIKALAHACIYSSDLARTEAFYTGTLGLPVQFRFIRSGKLFGYYLRVADGQFIEVFERAGGSSDGPHPIGHLCLETGDLVALRARLIAAGIEVTEPKLGADGSWQAWAWDPDGTALEFHQYTDQSTQRTGADCHVDW